jgi:hypothetical protein
MRRSMERCDGQEFIEMLNTLSDANRRQSLLYVVQVANNVSRFSRPLEIFSSLVVKISRYSRESLETPRDILEMTVS